LTQASLPAGAVNTVISIQASFAAGAFDIVTGDVERLAGRPPKPLRDVLAGRLKSPSAWGLVPEPISCRAGSRQAGRRFCRKQAR
jgi:hypothetical protein